MSTLMITTRVQELLTEYVAGGYVLVGGQASDVVSQLISLRKAVLDGPLVVGDINPDIAGRDIESRLLKVLESMNRPAIFLSSRDGFSDIFLSRFSNVVKDIGVGENKSDSFPAFKSLMIDTLKGEGVNTLLGIVKNSPSFLPLYLGYDQSRMPKKYKVMSLLVGSPS